MKIVYSNAVDLVVFISIESIAGVRCALEGSTFINLFTVTVPSRLTLEAQMSREGCKRAHYCIIDVSCDQVMGSS